MVNQLNLLAEQIPKNKVVRKFHSVVPHKFSHATMFIETLVGMDTLLIEVLTGRLKAAEELYNLDFADHGGGKLLLTEKEWCTRAMILTDPAAATPTRVATEDADVAWLVGAETATTVATMLATGRWPPTSAATATSWAIGPLNTSRMRGRREAHVVQEDAPDSGLPMTAVEENAALTTNLAATTAKLGARHPYCP